MSGGISDRRELDDRAELGIDGLSAVAMIGSGGSSTVHRARQDALDREVAVKVVHAAWTMETRERFEHERELMGRLSGHTAIVPIFETGITKRGEPYLLMPYYHRGSLFRLMRDRGPLPWPEAGFLLETVALTLADCHREGIVHRDVKPGNVMLTRHLHPRLADFGIALPLGMTTSPATVAYTPSYSPPEAFEPGVAAPTVDVYGLGATLWALLAGRAPHSEANGEIDPAVIRQRSLTGPVARPRPDIPAGLAQLIDRSMDPDPGRRPQDAGAFVIELRRATRLAGPPATVEDRATTGAGTATSRGPRLALGMATEADDGPGRPRPEPGAEDRIDRNPGLGPEPGPGPGAEDHIDRSPGLGPEPGLGPGAEDRIDRGPRLGQGPRPGAADHTDRGPRLGQGPRPEAEGRIDLGPGPRARAGGRAGRGRDGWPPSEDGYVGRTARSRARGGVDLAVIGVLLLAGLALVAVGLVTLLG